MSEEYEKLHPILTEVTRTFTQLYEHRKDESARQKLIKLEQLLEEKLAEIRGVKEKLEKG
ncbi:hypothetical protein BTA51_02310 [Hahella sp. CCB-MM4]|uniref:hypothetical protein n=1 Tax=Hahella sp. (strain CCB-MM4) TaxID=1926491 RepID=UPI000B9AAB05|nr:hypothetical protein [Hahella sp. CCB-MM4]OZG75238.1 hypothetical protein BTA51_02310 [Hahella sp. CCB-MM4]